MRQMRRQDRQTTQAEAYALIKNCEYAVLATINTDNLTPYCIPISPVLDGNYIYFHCAKEGQKIDNIIHNPHVCITCIGKTQVLPEQFTTLFESAVVVGKAEMITDEGEKKEILQKLCAKYSPVGDDKINAAIERSLSITGVCRITIEEICGKARKMPKQSN